MDSPSFFRLIRTVGPDGTHLRHPEPTDLDLKTGRPLPPHFTPPLRLTVHPGLDRGRLASMYFDPAWIVRRDLWAAMAARGPHAVEVHPAVLVDPDSGAELSDYVLVNLLATVSPPLLAGAPEARGGDGGNGGNGGGDAPAQDPLDLPHLFRLADDRSAVVVRDHLAALLVGLGAHDIDLEPVALA